MQKKSKPLPLGSGRYFATSFFLAQKLYQQKAFSIFFKILKCFLLNKPHTKVCGKTQKVFDN
mgnify:CR=1 FL=1